MSDLEVLAARFETGERTPDSEEALRRWFAAISEPPAAAFAARSPEQLLDACSGPLRPRAIELCDLLSLGHGEQPRVRSRPRSLWVVLDRGGGGVALRLSAWRVSGPKGLAADVRLHAGAERDDRFRRAEATASGILESRHPGLAVRYSIRQTDGSPYTDSIEDGSLGAALTVVAIGTTGGRSPFALDPRGALTGAVTTDGRIGSVDQGGLGTKALAAKRAGLRRLVVPTSQASALTGVGGIRVREAATIDRARRELRVLRPAAKAALVALLVLACGGGLLAYLLRTSDQDRERDQLAAERAMSRAVSIVDSRPREALQISAAAAQLDPGGTAPARSLIAASLPLGVRFLPDPPAPVSALTWTRKGVVAASRTQIYRLNRRGSGWVAGPAIPPHRLATFYDGQRLLLQGADGAWLFDPADGSHRALTSQPVRAIAGANGTAAALTRDGAVIVDEGSGPRRIPVVQPKDAFSIDRILQIAVTPEGKLVAADDLGRIFQRASSGLGLGVLDYPIAPEFGPLLAIAAEADHVVALGDQGVLYSRDSGEPDSLGPIAAPASTLLALPNNRGVALRRASAEVFAADGNYLTIRKEQFLPGRYRAAAVSPDGRLLVVAGREAATMRIDGALPSPLTSTETIAYGRDGALLGFSSAHGGALRLSPGGPSELIRGAADDGVFAAATVSPNGRWAAQTKEGGEIRLLDLWSRRGRTFSADFDTYEGPIEGFPYLGVLDDGRVTISHDPESGDAFEGSTYLVDPTQKKAGAFDYPRSGPFARELPPERLLLASGEHLDLVRLGDMTRADRVTVPGAYITALAANSSGREVFFGTSSGDVWSWAIPGDERPRRLGQVDGAVRSLVANRNGSVLFGTAIRGLRGPARLFAVDVPGAFVKLLNAPETGPNAGAALAPGQRQVAFSSSKPIGAELMTARLTPREACARAGSEVTPKAWRRAIGDLSVPVPRCPGD